MLGAGEESDIVDFLRSNQHRLSRLAYFLADDEHAAEDLVQETMVRVAVHWRRVRTARDPAAYARRVMVNHARSLARRRPSSREPAVSESWSSHGSHEAAVVDQVTLATALWRLTPRQRAVLYLRFYEDRSVAQTADDLGCSIGTVKSQTRHALMRLQQLNPGLNVMEEEPG